MKKFELLKGKPQPLGSHSDGLGTNFALYSEHAKKIELCLFNAQDIETCYSLYRGKNHIWHGYLVGAHSGLHYGYRAYGEWDPTQGLRFDPNNLLIDPYCRAISDKQNPRSIVMNESYDWQDDLAPKTPWAETIMYEAHVRGLTQLHPNIPSKIRGSYAAIAHPAIIHHLTDLGITALELLPVQLHLDEPNLIQRQLTNYWGYNPLAPFAIEPDYWSGQAGTTPLNEFRDMVKALHRAGIEVILDIVFNHSAELDNAAPTLCFRGLDNPTYYWLTETGENQNSTGCGNTLNLSQPPTIQWVLDCLHFWALECHVDGFRFDLATVLGRKPTFTPRSPLLTAIIHDPILSKLKLIAEPWDLGNGGYQLGQFPAPFAEWNDRFRDDIRQFALHGTIPIGIFANRFAGSRDLFPQPHHQSYVSINKITAHDGFTLRDLVSFNHKHNHANGEDNRDGNNQNYSHNHGYEGLDAPDKIQQCRQQSQRNLLTLLLLSLGTPMLLAGDELGHSQQGNNNAYCQDSAISWLNWRKQDKNLSQFTAQLISLRKQILALNSGKWWVSQPPINDVEWLDAQGEPLTIDQWHQFIPLQIILSGQWLLQINLTEQPYSIIYPDGNWHPVAPVIHHACNTAIQTLHPKTINLLQNIPLSDPALSRRL